MIVKRPGPGQRHQMIRQLAGARRRPAETGGRAWGCERHQ